MRSKFPFRFIYRAHQKRQLGESSLLITKKLPETVLNGVGGRSRVPDYSKRSVKFRVVKFQKDKPFFQVGGCGGPWHGGNQVGVSDDL